MTAELLEFAERLRVDLGKDDALTEAFLQLALRDLVFLMLPIWARLVQRVDECPKVRRKATAVALQGGLYLTGRRGFYGKASRFAVLLLDLLVIPISKFMAVFPLANLLFVRVPISWLDADTGGECSGSCDWR